MIPRFALRGARASYLLVPFICPLKGRIDIENDPDVVKQPVVNYLPNLEFCFVLCHWIHRSRIKGYLTLKHCPAVAVRLEAVAAASQEEEMEERQALVPGVALPVAWVFGIGS